MANKPKEKTIGDIAQIVFSHYKLFLAGFAMFIIGTMIVSLHIPVKYTTSTTFERQSDTSTDRFDSNKSESFNLIKLTLEDELCGIPQVEKVAEEFGLFKNLPRDSQGNLTQDGELEKHKIVREIKAGLVVEWKVSTPVMDQVTLSFTHTDPALAVELPNRLVKEYIEHVNGHIISQLRLSRNFLKKQLQESEDRLKTLSRKKYEFESQYSDISLSKPADMQDRYQETQTDIESLERQLMVAEQTTRQVRTELENCRKSYLKDELSKLENQVDECLSLKQMTEEHPEVIKLKARIAQLKQKIQSKDLADKINPAERELSPYESGLMIKLTTASGEENAIQTEIGRLQNRLENYKTMMSKSLTLQEEYLNYSKPVENQQSEVKRWNGLLSEVEMTLASEEANRRTQLKTISQAKKPFNPQFPPFWTILAIALGGGLAFGYSLAFVSDTMDHTIHTPEEATTEFDVYDVPVIGMTGEIMTPTEKAAKKLKRSAVTLVVSLILVTTVCLSTWCVMQKLQNPDQYKGWKSTIPPVALMDGDSHETRTHSIQ